MDVELVPLEAAAFAEFTTRLIPAYAAAKVSAGEWEESRALTLAQAELQLRLDQDLATPGHSLFAIRSVSSGRRVGDLWLEHRREAGRPVCVVLDIFIEPAERRRGYGRAALLAAEAIAHAAGDEEMRLTVFGDNEPASALYASLGYQRRSARLAKPMREGDRG